METGVGGRRVVCSTSHLLCDSVSCSENFEGHRSTHRVVDHVTIKPPLSPGGSSHSESSPPDSPSGSGLIDPPSLALAHRQWRKLQSISVSSFGDLPLQALLSQLSSLCLLVNSPVGIRGTAEELKHSWRWQSTLSGTQKLANAVCGREKTSTVRSQRRVGHNHTPLQRA